MSLDKPPLHNVHQGLGADFTDFGGWEMPVMFDSIRTEHAAVRESVGIFDVSHMSEVVVTGPDATATINQLTTNDVTSLDAGDAQYSCVLNDEGVILDDIVVYRYPDEDGYLFVPNAGHGEWMAERWSRYADESGLSVTVDNQTDSTGLVAVQGPDSVETVESVTSDPIGELSRFSWRQTEIAGVECHVARTGYTGEDGYEIFFPASDSEAVWAAFDGVEPCGLGARDTLRLEAGLLLSGQDFDPEDEPRTPLEAGLGFVVDLSKDEFVGQDALQDLDEAGVDERMVGIRIDEQGIARHGYSIFSDGTEIGHVTSGTMSPTLDVPIALGYVKASHAEPGTAVDVEVRGDPIKATVINQQFLDSLESN